MVERVARLEGLVGAGGGQVENADQSTESGYGGRAPEQLEEVVVAWARATCRVGGSAYCGRGGIIASCR